MSGLVVQKENSTCCICPPRQLGQAYEELTLYFARIPHIEVIVVFNYSHCQVVLKETIPPLRT